MPRRRSENEYYEDAHDERVTPNVDFDETHGGMPDPDWGGVLLAPPSTLKPVGDPTLWGNTLTYNVGFGGPADARYEYGKQIILAEGKDAYSRSWSLSGAVTCRTDVWGYPGLVPLDSPIIGPPNFTLLTIFLSIRLGIQKSIVEHQICLMSGGTNNIGLCNNQSTINGGPYFPTYEALPVTGIPVAATPQTRPFAAIGALVANTISIQPVFLVGGAVIAPIGDVKISCLITPYSPGLP